MANLLRFINNLCNHGVSEFSDVLDSIDQKFPEYGLGSSTPIPNQVLATDLNYSRSPSTMFFSKKAYAKLQIIREIDYECTNIRKTEGKADKPLEFVCYGYRDLDGDLFIEDIECPIFEQILTKGKRSFTQKDIRNIALNENISFKDLHTETTCRAFDHLRNCKFANTPVGDELLALLGTTKHTLDELSELSNCFTMKELAESVIPNVKVHEDIATGILAITPKSIQKVKTHGIKSPFSTHRYQQVDGSLECAIISYNRTANNYAKPYHISNVTRAEGITSDGNRVPIKISSSLQPTEGLYHAKPLNRDVMTNEMER